MSYIHFYCYFVLVIFTRQVLLFGPLFMVSVYARKLQCQEVRGSVIVPDGAAIPASMRGEPIIDPSDVVSVEYTKEYPNLGKVRISSIKRQIRNVGTREIFENRHLSEVWLDLFPAGQEQPKRVWSYATERMPTFLLDYTEPYGFSTCAGTARTIGVAFLQNKSLYFIETHPHASGSFEVVRLSDIARRVYGTANWEPIFKIEGVACHDDQWHVTVSIQGDKRDATNFERNYKSTFKRASPNSWVEILVAPEAVK